MERYSFTRAERIRKGKDFASVRKEGKRITGKNFVVFLKTNDLGIRRLGLAVSSKVGGAVKRNRIKRLFREFFRLNKESFPQSADIFISAKHGFDLQGYREVEREFQSMGFKTFKSHP